VICAVLVVVSCFGPAKSGVLRVDSSQGDRAWQDVLADHTRRDEPYLWAMRQADLRATLVTPRLRQAFAKHRDEFHGRFAEQTNQELVALGSADEGVDAAMKPQPDSEEQVVVFVAMFVADQKNRDLAASYTIWDTHLVRGNAKVKPIRIESVRISPAVMEVFPHVDRFDDVYVMRFPRQDAAGAPFFSPGGEPLRLEVKSALAHAEVEWAISE
jgi:hypothetical protein